MSAGPDPREVARYLRQRVEAGMPDVFLDGLDRSEALRAVKTRSRATVGAGGAAPGRLPGARARDGTEDAAREPAATGADLGSLDYHALQAEALGCTRCALAGGRTRVVFSDGPPSARLMVVGEAPGANEDRTGLPFVGAAGKLLDLILASVDLSRRDSVYICNVLKCRPPGNRDPLPAEIAACSPFLRRQIGLVAPEALLAVGGFAARLLTGSGNALGKLRGDVYSYEGVPLVVTYHPAALLRSPGWSRSTWEDLQLVRRVLDGS